MRAANYVTGFLFDTERQNVTLILKRRGPAPVIGKWNGLGGKIEEGEQPHEAMRREFREEAGPDLNWQPSDQFLTLTGQGFSVHFFHYFSSAAVAEVLSTTARTDEQVAVFNRLSLPKMVSNLCWILPMALTHFEQSVQLYDVREIPSSS